MSKLTKTMRTKGELVDMLNEATSMEFRSMMIVASYEALHGALPEGMFQAVIARVMQGRPATRKDAYEAAIVIAQGFIADMKASEEIKAIQNGGATSLRAEVSAASGNPGNVSLVAADLLQRGPYTTDT
jgi:hypothetical protein